MFSIIVAMTKDKQVIGKNGKIPWYIPEDLKYFRETTWGKTIIMGRKTFESIGKILPNRKNIVLTRKNDYKKDGILVFDDIKKLLKYFEDKELKDENHFVIGGGEIYKQFLDLGIIEKIFVTEIYKEYDGDTFFPEFKKEFKEISRKKNEGFDFVVYQKI